MLFSRRHFAVRHAASQDETRYNINGVRIEADGTTIATNGHWLCKVELEHADPKEWPTMPDGAVPSDAPLEPFTLPLDTVAKLVKALPKREPRTMPILANAALDVDATNANGAARFYATDLESMDRIEGRKIGNDYPDWRMVMPKEAPEVTFGISLVLLEGLCKAVREFSPDKKSSDTLPLKFELGKDEFCPIKITAEHDGGTLTAVLMPMRLK